MSRIHNWYLRLDNGQLLLNYAVPVDGGDRPEMSGLVRAGRGSESGHRDMKHINKYAVHTGIRVIGARAAGQDFEFLLPGSDEWRTAPWNNRLNNKNFPHHSQRGDVENLIGTAKKMRLL